MGEFGTAKDLAALLGVSTRTVRELAEKRIAVRATRKGQYDLKASVRAYCAHLRDVAAGRGGEDKVAALTSERARLAREQADAAALKNAITRGKLVHADDVERKWIGVLKEVRAAMLSIPSSLQQKDFRFDNHLVHAVDQLIRSALSSIATGETGA